MFPRPANHPNRVVLLCQSALFPIPSVRMTSSLLYIIFNNKKKTLHRRYGNYTPFTPRSSLETDRTSHFDAGGPSAGNGTSASERSLATALASFSQKTSRLSSRYHDDLARLESPAPTRSRLVSPGGRVSFEYDHSGEVPHHHDLYANH